MNYTEDDMLMLSGVQHYVFCPRQWALIHMDQQWAENALTTEGQILHKNVDNPAYCQKLNDRITLRSVHIASQELGLYGISDAIELQPMEQREQRASLLGLCRVATEEDTGQPMEQREQRASLLGLCRVATEEDESQLTEDEAVGITHPKFDGCFIPYPIEYKRGHHKTNECDTMQLVCQVMCLEEMYNITIPKAALFYWEVRRREEIEITEELRCQARFYAAEMHRVFESQTLPLACESPKCRRCSLKDICMPNLQNKQDVATYLKNNLYEEAT